MADNDLPPGLSLEPPKKQALPPGLSFEPPSSTKNSVKQPDTTSETPPSDQKQPSNGQNQSFAGRKVEQLGLNTLSAGAALDQRVNQAAELFGFTAPMDKQKLANFVKGINQEKQRVKGTGAGGAITNEALNPTNYLMPGGFLKKAAPGPVGAAFSGLNEFMTPSEDPNEKISDVLRRSGIATGAGYAMGKVGGKVAPAALRQGQNLINRTGITQAITKTAGVVAQRAQKYAPQIQKLADELQKENPKLAELASGAGKVLTKTGEALTNVAKGGPLYSLMTRAGVDPRTVRDPAKLIQSVEDAHDRLNYDIIKSISPGFTGRAAEGGKPFTQAGKGFYKSYRSARAAEDVAWQATREAGQDLVVPGGFNYAKELSNTIGDLETGLMQSSPRSGAAPAVSQLKKIYTSLLQKAGDDPAKIKLTAADLTDIKRAINSVYGTKQYPNLVQFGRTTDKLLNLVKVDAKGKPTQFGKLYNDALKQTTDRAMTFDNETINKLGFNDDVREGFKTLNRTGRMTPDIENELWDFTDKVKTPADVQALKDALPQEDFRDAMRATAARLLAKSRLDPEELIKNRDTLGKIIELSSEGGKMSNAVPTKVITKKLNDLQDLTTELDKRGINFAYDVEPGMSQGQIEAIKKTALGALTKHYMFALSQARNVIAPAEKASTRALKKFGTDIQNQAPGQFLGKIMELPILRNIEPPSEDKVLQSQGGGD